MKKVVTALMNKIVNEKLKEYENIEILMNDIQYQDGIFEALEINQDIDYIILSSILPGTKDIKDLIDNIKQIAPKTKIIIILEKKGEELENYLLGKGNIKIFYNNSVKIQEIAEIISNKNEDIEQQIKELKQIILEKEKVNYKTKKEEKDNSEIETNKLEYILTQEEKQEIEKSIELEYKNKTIIIKIINKIKKLLKKEKEKKNARIIIITGVDGVGKSVFVANIARTIENQKKNVLIIDLDYVNNSIQILFGATKEKSLENIQNISEEEIKISSKIQLISNLKINYNMQNENPNTEIENIIQEQKLKYDYIIIDSGKEIHKNITPIIKHAEKILCITETNIMGIKKTKTFLSEYIHKNNIEKEKIYLIFNKQQMNSLNWNIKQKSFKQYNILGSIDTIKNIDLLINNKMKRIFLNKKVKMQYRKIVKKLNMQKNIEKYYFEKIEQ